MNSHDQALARAQWQPALFAERPSRLELLKLKATWPLTPLTIRVHRNHAFEHLATVAEIWFAWWGKAAQFLYSDYDDSLSFTFDDTEKADLELLWLDMSRFAGRFDSAELVQWLGGRLAALRARTSAPIIVAAVALTDDQLAALQKAAKEIPACAWPIFVRCKPSWASKCSTSAPPNSAARD